MPDSGVSQNHLGRGMDYCNECGREFKMSLEEETARIYKDTFKPAHKKEPPIIQPTVIKNSAFYEGTYKALLKKHSNSEALLKRRKQSMIHSGRYYQDYWKAKKEWD